MDSTGRPVVLLVEDEPLIRLVTAEQLCDGGFVALEAARADDALALLAGNAEIDVLFTDVDMPGGMNGVALSRRVKADHPQIGLIVTSGKGLPQGQPLPRGCVFVGKPYAISEIALIVALMVSGSGE